MARTFQNLGLFSHLTVIDNLMLGRHHLMRTGFLSGALWVGGAKREEVEHRAQVEEIIDLLELEAHRHRPAGLLPYGLQKRLELGRALAMEPSLLLLDEPVAGMNLEETEDMARYILEVRERLGLAMILVEHEMQMVMDLADRVMALDFGRAIATGVPTRSRPTSASSRPTSAGPPRDRHRHGARGPAADRLAARRAAAPRPRAPRRVALREKRRGRWRETTWAEYAQRTAPSRSRWPSSGWGPATASRSRPRTGRSGCSPTWPCRAWAR